MRKVISLFLALVLISLVSVSGFASENDVERIYFEDGSYLEISTQYFEVKASGIKDASKTYKFTNSSGEISWQAVLHGTFTYTGSSATCTASSCNVTINNTAWYEISKTVSKSGASAICGLTMGRKFLGITVQEETINMTLTCDANGNLS